MSSSLLDEPLVLTPLTKATSSQPHRHFPEKVPHEFLSEESELIFTGYKPILHFLIPYITRSCQVCDDFTDAFLTKLPSTSACGHRQDAENPHRRRRAVAEDLCFAAHVVQFHFVCCRTARNRIWFPISSTSVWLW